MENFALIGIAENLRPLMVGLIIRRVIQHQPHGFILQTRSNRLPAIKIVMSAQNPAVYPSESRPPLESAGTDFLMVLRKHFTSAELVEFRKPLSDRVLDLVFKTAIPRNVRLAECPSFGKPVCLYDPHSSGAIAYYSVAQEVLSKLFAQSAQPVEGTV